MRKAEIAASVSRLRKSKQIYGGLCPALRLPTAGVFIAGRGFRYLMAINADFQPRKKPTVLFIRNCGLLSFLLYKELWPCPTQLPPGAFGLELYHMPEQSAFRHQLLRGTLLLHAAIFQHHDMIRPGHREAVASSSNTMGASLSSARAMEMRCRSPPESLAPFSPMGVW